MNALLQLIDISFSHSHETLFEALNLSINQNDKVGLVGHNGVGKSTLLALIDGQKALDSGEIRRPGSVNIALVEQFVPASLQGLSLIDAVAQVLPLELRLSQAWKAERQLMMLGFQQAQFGIPVKGLSGGQQNLLLIARCLILEPQLLLMDEPGNHMDISAMARLQAFLKHDCRCPFLIISHDRHLLDNVCLKTVFLRDKQIYQFDLPFSAAKARLAEEDRLAQKHRELEEKEIQRLKKTAKRLAIWGRENDNEDLSRKAKSIEKRADKLDQQKTQVSSGSPLKLNLRNHSLEAKQLLAIENLVVYSPDGVKALLKIDQLIIKPGDRIALLGVNGVGKSSTLETIKRAFDEARDKSENIRINPRAELGYYDQALIDFTEDITREDWLRQHTPANEEQLKRALINIGVPYEDFNRRVNTLSGGEKARMMFLAFSLNQPNFLILDEPTNHIDLEGKENLIEQLMQSRASLLITSHDRYFLQQIASRWFLIEDGNLVEIQDSEYFYESLLSNSPVQTVVGAGAAQKIQENEGPEDEDALMLRIETLENKLKADKSRKLKFQKPTLQQAWQSELQALWKKFD